MVSLARLKWLCLLVYLSVIASSTQLPVDSTEIESLIDDHATVRYILQEDLRSVIADLSEKLIAQEEKVNSLSKSTTNPTDGNPLASSIGNVPKQELDAIEERITDKLNKVIEAQGEHLRAENKAFQQKMLIAQTNSTSNNFLRNAVDDDSKTGFSDFELYQSISNDILGQVREEFQSFGKTVNETVVGQVKSLKEEFQSFGKTAVNETIEAQVKNVQGRLSSPIARTCQELMDSHPTLDDGLYYIDPDGLNVGDPPIRVRCEKPGNTIVMHDSMEKIIMEQCAEAGCYSRNVTYSDATMRQIKALIQLSSSCSQHFRYDCITAPLRFSDVNYAWWNDRLGVRQYYWTGNYSTTGNAHTCSCGLTKTCIDRNVKCNCDASLGSALFDEGTITDKNHLPVTRLNFGRLLSSNSSGEHTLGPLRCSGASHNRSDKKPNSCADLWLSGQLYTGLYHVQQENGTAIALHCDMSKLPDEAGFETLVGLVDIKRPDTVQYSSKVPSSCADLRKAGQSISGLYQVQTNSDADGKKISTVFCDMSKATGTTGFEIYIGINDVKSALVHFSVKRTSWIDTYRAEREITITYDHVWLNLGNAMNINTGVFTAPKKGIYSFTSNFVESDVHGHAYIRCNGLSVVGSELPGKRSNASLNVTLRLNAGDRVDITLRNYNDRRVTWINLKFINFSGYLLAEL